MGRIFKLMIVKAPDPMEEMKGWADKLKLPLPASWLLAEFLFIRICDSLQANPTQHESQRINRCGRQEERSH